MKIKILVENQYIISGIMKDDRCLVEDFLSGSNSAYASSRSGLLDMIDRVANNGFQQFSSKQLHYINEDPKIYEFIRGDLRLIFFHGQGNNVVVSTEVIVKKSQKVDKKVVNRAKEAYKDYFESVKNDTLIEVRDNENENE